MWKYSEYIRILLLDGSSTSTSDRRPKSLQSLSPSDPRRSDPRHRFEPHRRSNSSSVCWSTIASPLSPHSVGLRKFWSQGLRVPWREKKTTGRLQKGWPHSAEGIMTQRPCCKKGTAAAAVPQPRRRAAAAGLRNGGRLLLLLLLLVALRRCAQASALCDGLA